MRAKIELVPVAHLSSAPQDLPLEWAVFIDRVAIKTCPSDWPDSDIIVFHAKKLSNEHLMLPEAHFYGPSAYGVLIRHNRTHGTAKLWRAEHVRADHHRRKMTLLLCGRTGGPLPEISDQLYPSTEKVVVPVGYDTFNRFISGRWVTFIPDARRDLSGPLQSWIYVDADDASEDDQAIRIAARGQRRNYALPCGTTIKYGIFGSVLRPKVIRPPLSRDAGFHTAPGPLSRDRAVRTVYGKPITIKTDKFLLPDHDFKIGTLAVRVVKLCDNGVRAYRLH